VGSEAAWFWLKSRTGEDHHCGVAGTVSAHHRPGPRTLKSHQQRHRTIHGYEQRHIEATLSPVSRRRPSCAPRLRRRRVVRIALRKRRLIHRFSCRPSRRLERWSTRSLTPAHLARNKNNLNLPHIKGNPTFPVTVPINGVPKLPVLSHGSQIFVEPVERFLYHLSSRYIVSRVVDHAALLLWGRSQQTEHGLLRDFGRPHKIETAVEH